VCVLALLWQCSKHSVVTTPGESHCEFEALPQAWVGSYVATRGSRSRRRVWFWRGGAVRHSAYLGLAMAGGAWREAINRLLTSKERYVIAV
jgi:hypothetical protein